MDLNAVADGLAANAATITDLNTLAFAPSDGAEPLFWVGTAEEEFDTAMGRGQDQLTWTCYLAITAADDEAAQRLVREYMAGSGTRSIRTALRTDRSLAGAASDVRAMNAVGPVPVDLGGRKLLGARFTVQVIGRGNA